MRYLFFLVGHPLATYRLNSQAILSFLLYTEWTAHMECSGVNVAVLQPHGYTSWNNECTNELSRRCNPLDPTNTTQGVLDLQRGMPMIGDSGLRVGLPEQSVMTAPPDWGQGGHLIGDAGGSGDDGGCVGRDGLRRSCPQRLGRV